jgi:uncharacterized protein (DUF58 family)
MLDSPPLLDPRALARIANLEVVARKVVEGTISGLHRSPLHGFSTDFLQHRPYAAGDDLRYLDWKIFGRTDRHYVRQFEEETNLRATIFIDASGSMEYAGEGVSKIHYAVRVAAALAYLLVSQQDEVGLVVFDDAVRKRIAPRAGRRQLQLLFSELGKVRAGGETSIASVIRDVAPGLSRRGLLVFLSDGFDEPGELVNSLARLHSAQNEVILIQVLDRAEVDFRFPGWTRFENLETEDESILVDPAQLRTTYLERFRTFTAAIDDGCRRHGIVVVRMVNDTPYDEALAGYLSMRRRKS